MGVTPFFRTPSTTAPAGRTSRPFSDRGHGVRRPIVFYNRFNEAAALLKPGDLDWRRSSRAACAVPPGGMFARSRRRPVAIIEGMKARRRPSPLAGTRIPEALDH